MRRWLRFSLATFLFVSLCIGGMIGGYQSGFRRGYHSGQETRYNESQVTETYSTLNLVWPDLPAEERTAAVNSLKDLIQSTIATDVWVANSGNEIRDFPSSGALIVTAPGSVHGEIRQLFAQLERLSSQGGAEQLIPVLQSLASQGKSQTTDLQITAPKNSQVAHAWLEKYFGITVEGVSKRWGTPQFDGPCSDAEFPKWSLDQRLAAWPRGDGLAYIALRYADDGQLHLFAGWRKQS